MHKRGEIRRAIVARLQDGIPGVSVYDSRIFPLMKKNLPAISVYAIEEAIERSKDEGLLTRKARIVIAAYVNGSDASEPYASSESVDSRLDEIAGKVEYVFDQKYETLGANIYRFYPVSVRLEVDGDGEWIFGMAFMEYEAVYHDTNQ